MKMKMKLTYLLSASVGISASYAQTTNLTQLLVDSPQCALGCVSGRLSAYNCSLNTLASCLCTNIPFQAELSVCVQKSCLFEDQVRAGDVALDLCAWAPKESRSAEVKRVAIILSAVTFPLVALRCISRWRITGHIWWDDGAALAATFFLAILGGIEIASAFMGFGNHYWDVSASEGTILLKLFYFVQTLYVLVQDLAKLSILLLYHRVFPRPWFKLTTRILMIFTATHGFAFLITLIFQCYPISSIWDRTVTGKCIDLTTVGYVGAAISIGEDLVILVLPISELNTLSFGIKKRISLMVMFGIGSFACVTSMIRLKYLVAFGNSFDSTWDNVDVVVWSLIELYTAIICACLPSLRPLLIQYLPSVFKSITPKNNTGGDGAYRMNHWMPSLRNNASYGGLGDEVTSGNHRRSKSRAEIAIVATRGVGEADSDAGMGNPGVIYVERKVTIGHSKGRVGGNTTMVYSLGAEKDPLYRPQ